MADWDKAIKLDPELALAYNNRGAAYCNKGEFDKAIADCDKAIELDPELALAYNNRGWAYCEKEKWDLAIADLDKAIELGLDGGRSVGELAAELSVSPRTIRRSLAEAESRGETG